MKIRETVVFFMILMIITQYSTISFIALPITVKIKLISISSTQIIKYYRLIDTFPCKNDNSKQEKVGSVE